MEGTAFIGGLRKLLPAGMKRPMIARINVTANFISHRLSITAKMMCTVTGASQGLFCHLDKVTVHNIEGQPIYT